MQLSIQSLMERGSFTGRPVKKEITWKQGDTEHTATVFVRPLGYQSAVSDLMSGVGKQDGVAGRIAVSICDEAGNPVFTVGDITGAADPERGALDGNLSMALLTVIGEVNQLGKMTSSPTKTSSGTKLRSRSGPRSPKPKNA